ncbi:MAG: energy-coupling factor transporter ATPase [Coriobacteriales bacterium]|nr:energy-coupling factor transporter ATPase [Coriobacteriales bacterium]
MGIVEFHDVSFSYDGENDVLNHLTLGIEQGDYVAVLGPNGSGKSTFARCIDALLIPDFGSVTVMGLDTSDTANHVAIRRSVGMVFQNPDNQMVTSVVADDVAFGPENLGNPQPEIAQRVTEALDSIGMLDYAQADPQELSGGQKQRVSLAGILAMKPSVIVLDESTSMLDPQGRADVLGIMKELHSRGITIIHITHSMEEALEANRVVVLNNGSVILDGPPKQVFSHEDELQALGLELPFALRLSARLHSLGIETSCSPYINNLADTLIKQLGPQRDLSTPESIKESPDLLDHESTAVPYTSVPSNTTSPAKHKRSGTKRIALGQYYHTNSFLHTLDPRVKLVLVAIFMVSVMFAKLPWGLIPIFIFLAVSVLCSHVPAAIIAHLCRPLLIFVLLTFISNALYIRTGSVLFSVFGLPITSDGIITAGLLSLRIFALMLGGVLFALTTTPVAITDATEKLFSPLARLGLPVQEFGMMTSIAIRFVPILSHEMHNIVNAQASRGAALGDGSLIKYPKALVSMIVPLFASALRHANELGQAMDARCYNGGEGRTHYHVLKIEKGDYIAIAAFCMYLIVLMILSLAL